MKKMSRKLASIATAAAMAAAMVIPGAAAAPVTVTVNGNGSAAPAYVNDDWRTMVSADIAQELGLTATVSGDSVTFTDGTTTQTYTVGAEVDGTAVELVDGTIYVPFANLAQTFGFTVGWDAGVASAQKEQGGMTDFDSITELEIDWSQAAQLPLTGWYTKSLEGGRQAAMYISEHASIRTYVTILAVPNGVDTQQFLEAEGWIDLMEEKGEALFVLEPGAGGWGTAQEESAYVTDAIDFLKSGRNSSDLSVFSSFGEFYVVGYGDGAAPLELWAAANPIFVISQYYAEGVSTGADALTGVASAVYPGTSGSGSIEDVLDETLAAVGIGGTMAPKDVPVPTWLADYTGSDAYWKTANDCVAEAVDGVYRQAIDSDGYATAFANQQQRAAGEAYGISQVKVSDAGQRADEIYSFLAAYTRYDTTFAYSNALSYRLDYTAAKVEAQEQALDLTVEKTLSDGTQIISSADVQIAGHGTVQIGVFAFSDNNGDGRNDPREYLLYIPEGFEGQELPIVMVFPGNTQTDIIFMDSTSWWQIAEENGVVLAFVCETYSGPTAATHVDSDLYYHALLTLLKEEIDGSYADLDFTRIYATGQSLGSNTAQGFAMTNPEFFAAVATTSGTPIPSTAPNVEDFDPIMVTATDPTGELIPSMMIVGQMDSGSMADGFDSAEDQMWANYMLEANGFDCVFAADTATSVTPLDSRHTELYTWSRDIDGVDVPLLQFSQTLLRPHNCYPSDLPILWDFMEHFSFVTSDDGTITRYYSASAFEQDDAVVLE